jgi:hypothetical protein
MADRCAHCGHAGHRTRCPAKGPSSCRPLVGDDGEPAGIACYQRRPPCACPWRTCKCGALTAEATALDQPGITVPVLRGSAGEPGGLLAVRLLADGTLGCRDLKGLQPGPGEWRATEHDGPCQELHGPTWQEAAGA